MFSPHGKKKADKETSTTGTEAPRCRDIGADSCKAQIWFSFETGSSAGGKRMPVRGDHRRKQRRWCMRRGRKRQELRPGACKRT